MQTINISTGKTYQVLIGKGLLPQTGDLIQALPNKKYKRIAIVSDSNVAPFYANVVQVSLEQAGYEVYGYVVAAGEQSKSFEQVIALNQWLCEKEFTRSDLLVALGGGVVGDLTGFVASIFLRGIDFVQIPTTLLSDIDSSVGGKTGIDIPQGKNLVGSFWQPKLVICDANTLSSLRTSDFSDGVAEAVKYGCIWDANLFKKLSTRDWIADSLEKVISTCVTIKANVVKEDEFDTGLRQILNFGHTVGHAVEKLSNLSITHGQGVAIGMCVMARAGETAGITPAGTALKIKQALEQYQLPTQSPYSAKEVASACLGDKKRSGDTLTVITLTELGKYSLTPIPVNQMESFLKGGMD